MLAIKTRAFEEKLDYNYIGKDWTSKEPKFNKEFSELGFFNDTFTRQTDVVITVQEDGTLEGGLCWIPSSRQDYIKRWIRYGIVVKGHLGDADTTTFMQLAARVVQAKNDSSQKEAIGKVLDEYFTNDKVSSLLGSSFDPEAEFVKKLREIAGKYPLATDEPDDKDGCMVELANTTTCKKFYKWLSWLANTTKLQQPLILGFCLNTETDVKTSSVKMKKLESFLEGKFGGAGSYQGYIVASDFDLSSCGYDLPHNLKKKHQIVPKLRTLPLEGAMAAAAVAIAILLAVIVLINQKPREDPPQQTNPPMIQEEF